MNIEEQLEESQKVVRDWSEKYTWGSTQAAHVWLNVDTAKYHFSDEAEQIAVKGYDSFHECVKALKEYCEKLRNGVEK